VSELRELLGCTADQAIAILRYFKWNLDKLQNEWFNSEKQLRNKIGIEFDLDLAKKFPFINASTSKLNQGYCQICYMKFNNASAT